MNTALNTEVFFHRGYLFVCGELSFGNISQGEFQHETRVLAYRSGAGKLRELARVDESAFPY